jgi:hypothetical protein
MGINFGNIMKGNLKMIRKMVMELYFLLMGVNLKDILVTINVMV